MRTRISLAIASLVLIAIGCGSSSNNATGGSSGSGSGTSSGSGSSSGGSSSGGSSSGGSSSSGSSSSGSSSGGSSSSGSSSGGASTSDAGPGGTGGSTDAGLPPVNLDGGTTIVIAQPISGTPAPTTSPLHGPGLILMGGGTDVDAAFVWMHDTIAGSSTAKMGNILVFNVQSPPPSVDNDYTAYIYGLAPFQSVQTVYLGGYKNDGNNATAATVTDVEIAAYYITQADGVFFAGGDQADYVYWYKTSPTLSSALTALYNRGGVIGGTSAGCSIQGPFVFDDLAADDQGADPATADVVANPYESSISFTLGMLTFPALPKVLADPHFVTRDRFGRLAGFVARQYADNAAPNGVVGVGIDESNALLIDKTGKATLVQESAGTEADAGTGAYILTPAGGADTCKSGEPLLYKNISVTRLSNPSTDSFDFSKGCGSGAQFTVTVDGSNASNPYSPSPYTATGSATKCP